MPVEDNDILRVTAKMSLGTNDVQNVYHLKVAGDPETQDAVWDGIAAWLEDAYTEVLDCSTGVLHYDTIEVFNITKDEPVSEDAWPSLAAGTGSGSVQSANQVAPIVKFPTLTARSQGRKYLPPFMWGMFSGEGVLSSAALTAITAFAAEILSGVAIDGSSSAFAGNWSPLYQRFATWVSAIVDDVSKTQRRRVRGVGS
jgi:hypothetical protein